MIAQPLGNSSPEPGDGKRRAWIGLEEAARRSGMSERHLRRECCQKWFALGMARLVDGGGKRPRWQVCEDADPSLRGILYPDEIPFDAQKYTKKQRGLIYKRREVVLKWRDWNLRLLPTGATREQITTQFLQWLQDEWGFPISRGTLYNWDRNWRRFGKEGLADERWKNTKAEPPPDCPFLEEVKRLFLNERRRSKKLCFELALYKATEERWETTSYRTACRALSKIPAATLTLYREGEEAYTNSAPYNERDYSTIDSNDVWISDHHPFDVWVVGEDGKPVRPNITAWMDARSRLIVGFCIFDHSGNADTIVRSFRAAVLAHGKPREVLVDCGKDYESRFLQGQTKAQRFQRRGQWDLGGDDGVFGQLGIRVRHAKPYHPQSKPIERYFATVEDRFGKLFDTYCGNCPETRPEDLEQMLERGKAPTLAEFRQRFETWLAGDYHVRPHGGDAMDGQTPLQAFNANLRQKQVATEEQLDLATLQKTPLVKVGRNGVTWRGINYGAGEPALVRIDGERVHLRIDERDVGRVSVWTAEDKFVCVVRANVKMPWGADSQLLRKAEAQQRRDKKKTKEYIEIRPRLHDSVADRAYRMHARRSQETPKPPPPDCPIVPVRTRLDDQLPALRRGLESDLRRAAGAESLSFRDLGKSLTPDEEREGGESTPAPARRFRYERAGENEEPNDPSGFVYPDAFRQLQDALRPEQQEQQEERQEP